MSTFIKFNLNWYIKVKLNDAGYQRLADIHNTLIGHFKGIEYRDAAYYKAIADKDGYTRFQAWEFMQDFGPTSRLGKMPEYDLNILIEQQ